MEDYRTPSPAAEPSTESPLSRVVTEIMTKGNNTDDGALAALIGGIVGALLLLLLICAAVVLLWRQSRQKGSYVTNEVDVDDIDDEDDDESVGSQSALQSRESLKLKEEE